MLFAAVSAESPDFELDELENQFPELHRGLLRYGRHFHHNKNRHAALLKHNHHLHHRQQTDLDAEANLDLALDLDADDAVADAPMTLPGRHPSVEKALDGMSDDLQKLKESKFAAKEARGQLEGTVTDTFHHMNDRMAIKRAMNKKEQELRIENGKLETLENDAGRLEHTHDDLMHSLHRMLGPKVMMARERYSKKQAILRREESAAQAWKAKRDEAKISAMELLKQKKASHQALLEAEEEVARAKKKEELARLKYQHDTGKTAEQVQQYRYAETRYNAELQHEKAAQKAAAAARESVEKLYHVAEDEEVKVDQSVLYRKDKLRAKIQKLQAARQKSSNELNGLEQKYRDWKEQQRQRTAEVMKKSQETAAASEVYQATQQKVLDTARAKVVQEAEAAGDWDGWGNDFTKAADEDDDD